MVSIKTILVFLTVYYFIIFALIFGNHFFTWLYLALFCAVANLDYE